MGMLYVTYDGGSFIDSFSVNTLEHGKAACIDILTGWIDAFCSEHDISSPADVLNHPELVEQWDSMIDECTVYVYDSDDPEWYCCYAPEDDELRQICWLFSDDMKEVFSHE